MSEEELDLVRRFQAGDQRAFDVLVQKHKDRVFRLCYRLLGDYTEADDAAQETFIKVYHSLRGFRFESGFWTWVYRIAVNTCKNTLMSLRFRLKKKTLRLESPTGSEEDAPVLDVADSRPSARQASMKREEIEEVRRAIDALPAEDKTVVVLRDIEGMSYEEIAEVTGLRLGTLKSRLFWARQALRKKLEKGKTE